MTEENYDSYMSMSQILLLSDFDGAMQMAEKAIQHNKSKYMIKQGQEVKNYIKAVKNNKPYEGCLRLIKSDTITSDSLKEALIEKNLKDYPNIKNAARNELEKLYATK